MTETTNGYLVKVSYDGKKTWYELKEDSDGWFK